jgi:hypothetical protein
VAGATAGAASGPLEQATMQDRQKRVAQTANMVRGKNGREQSRQKNRRVNVIRDTIARTRFSPVAINYYRIARLR